jgi:hypothetical protein
MRFQRTTTNQKKAKLSAQLSPVEVIGDFFHGLALAQTR